MVDFALQNFTTDQIYTEEFFRKILETAAKEVSFGLESRKIELSINLVGEGRIKALNKKYRGRNRVTDVLSFPLTSGHYKSPKPQKHSMNRGLEFGPMNFPSKGLAVSPNLSPHGIMPLGDIFICLPVAKKHAQREGISLDSKMAFLTAHGFLHLLGYDHEKTEDQGKMFEMQDRILKKVLAVGG